MPVDTRAPEYIYSIGKAINARHGIPAVFFDLLRESGTVDLGSC